MFHITGCLAFWTGLRVLPHLTLKFHLLSGLRVLQYWLLGPGLASGFCHTVALDWSQGFAALWPWTGLGVLSHCGPGLVSGFCRTVALDWSQGFAALWPWTGLRVSPHCGPGLVSGFRRSVALDWSQGFAVLWPWSGLRVLWGEMNFSISHMTISLLVKGVSL